MSYPFKKRLLTFMCLFTAMFVLNTSIVVAGEAEDYIERLKSHYKKTSGINSFSLTHSYLGQSDPYQSWDYQAPSRYKAFKITDIDINNKFYVQSVVHHFTGGRLLDEVHFQNTNESFRYDINGNTLGKGVLKQSMKSFDLYKNLTFMNLDFFAVKPLLEEKNIKSKILFNRNKISKKITLTHQTSDNKIVEYVFNDTPTRLLSIHNKSRRRIYIYDDYQTSNGLTFARSLIKYYNGDTKPSFITRMEHFEVLDHIEPAKLKLPKEYERIIPNGDKNLVFEKIDSDLYLIINPSTKRNTLFKINNDEIMVFGAPVNRHWSQKTIELITDNFPKKKITSVYVTHPYSDHINGLPAFAELGAVILADTYTIEAIRAYPKFKEELAPFKFKTIAHTDLVDGVRFYVLENSRAKRQSFAYLESKEIIYQSDFLEVSQDNTIVKILPSYSKSFIDFIKSQKLTVNRVIGHHGNNNISQEVMNKLYDSNTM